MTAFRVWLRPLGEHCRVRVDGIENARWLVEQLRQSPVFKTREPIAEASETPVCGFAIPIDASLSRSGFQKLLAAIPEVELMHGPE